MLYGLKLRGVVGASIYKALGSRPALNERDEERDRDRGERMEGRRGGE